MEKIKIVLVDDHRIIMDGIASLILSEEDMEIVGQVLNRDELFQLLSSRPVNLVMLDIFLPKPVGIEILKSIGKQYPKVKVIILSGNDEEDLILGAFQAGAYGYLTKSVEKDELIKRYCLPGRHVPDPPTFKPGIFKKITHFINLTITKSPHY